MPKNKKGRLTATFPLSNRVAFQVSTAPLTRSGIPLSTLKEGSRSLILLAAASDNETLVTSFLLVNDKGSLA